MQACTLVSSHWQQCQSNKKRFFGRVSIIAQIGVFALDFDNGVILGFHWFLPLSNSANSVSSILSHFPHFCKCLRLFSIENQKKVKKMKKIQTFFKKPLFF